MDDLIGYCLEPHPDDLPCLLDPEGSCLQTYGSLLAEVRQQQQLLEGSYTSGTTLLVPPANSPEFIIQTLAALGSGLSVLPAPDASSGGMRSFQNLPEPSFLRWTSGSVAAPQLASIPVSAILRRVDAAREAMPFDSNDCILWFMPMADHFLVSILLYLASGASMVLIDSPDRQLNRPLHNVTTLYGLPYPLIEFLRRNENPDLLPGLRRVYAGGEAIPAYLNDLSQKRFGIYCTPFWGLIEVGVPALGTPAPTSHPGSVGRTSRGYRIEARTSQALSIAELYVDGPGLYAGYIENNVFVPRPDGPLATGDSGYEDEAGHWVLTGRVRQSFEWKGRRWMAQELEALALRHPDVIACRLLLRHLPEIRLEYQSAQPLGPETLLDHCRARTDLRLDSLQVEPVPTIPRTRTGKVDRLG